MAVAWTPAEAGQGFASIEVPGYSPRVVPYHIHRPAGARSDRSRRATGVDGSELGVQGTDARGPRTPRTARSEET